MKRFIHVAFVLAVCAVACTLLAAQQPKKEQPKRELFFVIQEIVKSANVEAYEAATKQFVRELEQYKIDPEKVNFETIAGAEFGYIYVIPLKDFADMETVHDSWMEAVNTIGADRFEELEAAMAKTIESKNAFHVTRLADLSYEPAKPATAPENYGFLHYEFYHVIPGKEKDFEALAVRFKEFNAKHNISQGWSLFKQITGEDLPLYIVVEGARSAADYYSILDATQKAHGDELKPLVEDLMACTRKVEKMTGTPQPELSYPNPKAARN